MANFIALGSIAGSLVGAVGAWTVLPDLWFHRLRRQVVWRGPSDVNRVALTFDDGPDPVCTPRVLETLARHDVQAAFFLIGKRASTYPRLVREISDAGHDIGNHTYNHLHPWSLGPAKTFREVRQGKDILEQIIGKPVAYFRPPWGTFNLLTFSAGRTSGQIVLWSYSAKDWQLEDVETIVQHVLSKSSPGTIILMHAAKNVVGTATTTVAALPKIISGLKRKGLDPVPLRQLT